MKTPSGRGGGDSKGGGLRFGAGGVRFGGGGVRFGTGFGGGATTGGGCRRAFVIQAIMDTLTSVQTPSLP